MWGWTSIERFGRDLAYGVRQMVRHRGFTAVAVVTLALGIGGTTAIFSVFNALVLNPLPYAEPHRLVWVAEALPHAAEEFTPAPHFLEWRDKSRTLAQVGAYTPEFVTLTDAGDPERLDGSRASASFLPTLGVTPLVGRHFLPAEDRPGGEHVVMLGHDLWRRRFGGDADIVGRVITLDEEGYQVVGVLPPDFRFFHPFDLWMPLALDPEQEGRSYVSNLQMVARLAPGVVLEDARAELEALRRLYEESKPPGLPLLDGTVRMAPLQDVLVGDSRQLLLVLLGAVSLVLLIACANVANLLLSRAVTRQREFALRAALGAGRLRLVRQVLTESVLLAGFGGGLGLLAAIWLTGVLGQLTAPNSVGAISQVATIAVDLRVLGFAALVALATGMSFGIAPALQLSRQDVARSLKSGRLESGARGGRLRHLFMMAQVAITIVLLAGAGLLIRSFVTLLEVDPGYRPENLLTLRVTLPEARYPHREQREAFYGDALQRVSVLPGVRSVAASHHLPLTRSMFRGWLSVPGRADPRPDEPPTDPPTPIAAVSPEYFRTMGIRLRMGRLFTDADHADSPRVVILSESLARHVFKNEDPLGQSVRVPGPGKGVPTVIGVVGDIRHEGLDRDVMPQVYVPLRQNAWASMALVVRADSDPLRLATAVRNQVLAVDPHLPIYDVQSMERRLEDSMAPRRVNLLLIGAFALLALTLAAVGVYGVRAYAVTQRTHEIGIRIALGARGADVLKLLVGHGMMPVAAGVAVGLFSAWALTRVMAGLLFGVSTTDPVVCAGTALVVTVVALVASYIPASRALRIDPTEALRHE